MSSWRYLEAIITLKESVYVRAKSDPYIACFEALMGATFATIYTELNSAASERNKLMFARCFRVITILVS